uniref:Uncharacterized protein LOC111122303 n=1 Tax=Crassostrea virginica TaxID=6565 RepID=A0A8B8CYV5_CRAVI|nr:uncharacterized protein LOC111122303 [Crassostrea virginica]
MEKSTISNLKFYGKPPVAVKDVVSALILILGYETRIANNWGECQKILGDFGILVKINNFDPTSCTLSAAQESEKILDNYSMESIRKNDLNAAKVFKWTKSMIEKVKSVGGLKG